MTDDEEARRERARRLRERIEGLRSGEGKPAEPTSPREFLDREADKEMKRKGAGRSDGRS